MPFAFSAEVTQALPISLRCLEDRRNNPVRNRNTVFRLLQQNMLAYTFPDFVPGFAESGINTLSIEQIVQRPTENARQEGRLLFRDELLLSSQQIAKVEGDVFELVEAAIHWNMAARWNRCMTGGDWPTSPRYPRPTTTPNPAHQIAVLSLPRRYDWVRLLTSEAAGEIQALRHYLTSHQLSLPTSTPDIMIVSLPQEYRSDTRFQSELPNLNHESQRRLAEIHREMEGRIAPKEFVLAIALKKSLRSDRLYQPLYEANIMQLLLEGRLGAERVDFEVHTLESAGTAARDIYSAASLAGVATQHAQPHRAVRELYEPTNASELVRRFLTFLNGRFGVSPSSSSSTP